METLIALLILSIIAAVSMPYLYQAIKRIELESIAESTANGVAQLFAKARSLSIKEKEFYTFSQTPNGLKFSSVNGNLNYTTPQGISKRGSLSITKDGGTLTGSGTLCYVLGMFVEQKNDQKYELLGNESLEIAVNIDDNPQATVTVQNSLATFELKAD